MDKLTPKEASKGAEEILLTQIKQDFITPANAIFDYVDMVEKILNEEIDKKVSVVLETLKGGQNKLDVAVEEQNFEEAVKLRDQIKSLEKNKEKISELQTKLDECIKKQDFEKAIEYRDKIKDLK